MAQGCLFVKLSCDLIFLIASIFVLFSPVFSYMNGIKLNLVSVTYEVAGIEVTPDNNQEACSYIGIDKVCELLEDFIIAGVLFSILLMIANVLMILSVTSVFSANLGLPNVLRIKIYHILYPLMYTTAFIAYIQVSGVLHLSSYGLGDDYKMHFNLGFYFMILLEMLSVISLVAHCSSKVFCICDLEKKLLD